MADTGGGMDIGSMASGAGMGVMGIAQYLIGYLDQQKNTRPTYEIPKEIQENLSQSELMALQGLPEEQKRQYISNVQRSQAYAMDQAGSRRAGLTGLATINQQGQNAYSQMLSQDAAARMQNQRLLMAQRQNMADYKDQQFQINKVNPYYERTAKNAALMGAGAQNTANSFAVFGGGSGTSSNPTQGMSDMYSQNSQNGYRQSYGGNTETGGDMNYANQYYGNIG